jgi:hypothetical protein
VTLRILLVDAPHLGGSATSTRLPGKRQDSGASQDKFFKMTHQFERKYSTQGSGAPCHVSFGFFSTDFLGYFLPRLQMDPQPEPATQPKARGLLHMECDFAIALPYQLRLQDKAGIFLKTFGAALGDAWDYSRRLQDCSDISWSTFQPRDASTTLEDF